MSPNSELTHPPDDAGAPMSEAEWFVMARFLESARLLEEATAKRLRDSHGMGINDYEVLARLDHAGGEMRLPALVDACVVSTPTITQTLVGLEDRGWIRRQKAVGDARGTMVHLLEPGAAALAAAAPDHVAIVRQRLLSCWGASELAIIGRAMDASATRLRTLRR